MSKVQVDTIDTRSGTSTMQIGSTNTSTINIGVSGDTVNIPSGVTIANAGTATGFGTAGTNIFRASMSGNQSSVSNNTWTKVAFDTDVFDADGVFDTSNNRFIAPAAGKYLLIGKMYVFPNNQNGPNYYTRFYKNGGAATKEVVVIGLGSSDNYLAEVAVMNTTILDLAQNDYIELYARFKSGSGTITFDSTESIFQGFRLA